MKQFLVKALLLLGIVALSQWGLGFVVPYSLPVFDFDARVTQAAPGKPQVIYLGDSVLTARGKTETAAVSIPARFQELNQEYSVLALDHGAMQPAIQSQIMEWVEKKKVNAEFVILPINLRAFSLGWRMNPNFQFAPQRVLLNLDGTIPRAWLRSLFVWKFYTTTPVTKKVYDAAYEDWYAHWDLDAKTYSLRKLQFLECYLYELPGSNPLIDEIKKIISLQRSLNRKCLVYLTPVDVVSAEYLAGPELVKTIDKNVTFLKSLIKQEGADWLDLHAALQPEDFVWKDEAVVSEHLNAHGRDFVAGEVSRAAQALFHAKTGNK